jgi:hypothetical protein
MTRTVRTSLGSSPLTGKSAIDQAARFKDQLRSVHRKPAAISLITVTHADPPNMEVVAWYDADDPNAREWVQQAEAVSGELWQKLNERRKGLKR